MVISFKEQDRIIIEAYGMTIIEFKRILYRMEKTDPGQLDRTA